MKIRITSGMFMALVINMVYAKAIGLTQGIMAREVGSDIWIATILATLQGAAIMALIASLLKRTTNRDVMEYASLLLGKWGGRALGLVMLVFFAGAYGAATITLVYHMMDYFVPEAPIVIFVIAGTLMGMYGSYLGLEVMGRMALAGLFALLALNILLLVGAIGQFDLKELMPVFQSGWVKPLLASRQNDTDWAMATMMAAFILPMVNGRGSWRRAGVYGVLFGGLFVIMWPVMEVGVLSPEVTSQYVVACMQMARSAHIGNFIQRYEMFMIALFAISALIQCMVCLFCGSLAASKVVGLADYRPMLIPVGIAFGAFGYWVVKDHMRAMDLLGNKWPWLCLSIAVGVPVLLWLLSILFPHKVAPPREGEGRPESE